MCVTSPIGISLIMADDFRNFRSYYYDKVGFRGVEEKKSLEVLLNEKPISLPKLSQFCLRFSLSTKYREYIWNILLGVLPQNPDSHEFVQKHQEEQFKDLQHCLLVIEIANEQTPLPQLLTYMILLDEGELRLNHEQQLLEIKSQCILSLATTFTQICSHSSRAYFLLKHFWRLIKDNSANSNLFIEKFIQVLKQEDLELYQHLYPISVFNSFPFGVWFSQCFAGILPETSLERIWDKVIASGSQKIIINLTVSLFITLRRSLLNINSSNTALKFLREISEDTADIVVNNALESWYQSNSSSTR